MTDNSVAALRTAADRAVEEIGKAQGALGLAGERVQTSRDILRISLEGSGRDESAAAQAALTEVDTKIEEAVAASLVAVEQLVAWTGTL